MFERFSETLIKSVVVAQEEANSLGWFVVGTEFLLLGLLSTTHGIAAQALNSQGVNFLNAQLAVKRKLGYGPGPGLNGTKFSPLAKTLLKKLAQRGKVNNENISSRHLLLAFLELQNESVKPVGAIEILRVLKVDLLKLEKELLRLHESEADAAYPESDFHLSGSSVVERFDDSTIKAVLYAQRRAWEVEAAAVEVRHIILGLIRFDAYIAELFVGVDFEEQLTKTEFFGVSGQSSHFTAIPFSAQVKGILEQSEASRASLGQRFVSPKHILAVLLSIPDVVTAEGLEKLLPNYVSLESLIKAVPGVILPLPPIKTVAEEAKVSNDLPKPYDPTDDAVTLKEKIIQWEAEAELCRRVEKEALRQADLCRQALADLVD